MSWRHTAGYLRSVGGGFCRPPGLLTPRGSRFTPWTSAPPALPWPVLPSHLGRFLGTDLQTSALLLLCPVHFC